MEHWELGYHRNRKCNKVNNEVGKVVLSVETGQYEPKWEWEQETYWEQKQENLTMQKWEWEQ